MLIQTPVRSRQESHSPVIRTVGARPWMVPKIMRNGKARTRGYFEAMAIVSDVLLRSRGVKEEFL